MVEVRHAFTEQFEHLDQLCANLRMVPDLRYGIGEGR